MKQKDGILDPQKIHILDYSVLKGSIETPLGFDPTLVDGYESNVSFDMSFNIDENLAKADIQVKVQSKSSNGQQVETEGFFHLVFVFMIENLIDLVNVIDKKEAHLDINPDLGNALGSVTYSTTRGVLMTRFQGTALSGFIMPVINPNSLL